MTHIKWNMLYLIPTAKAFQIVARNREGAAKELPSESQLTLLGAVLRQSERAFEMDGIVMHNHRDEFFYVTRMLFRRVPDGQALQTLRLFDPQNPPDPSDPDDPSPTDIRRLQRPIEQCADFVWKL